MINGPSPQRIVTPDNFRTRDAIPGGTMSVLNAQEDAIVPRRLAARSRRADRKAHLCDPRPKSHVGQRSRRAVPSAHQESEQSSPAESRPFPTRLHVSAHKGRVRKLEVTNWNLKFELWRPPLPSLR